MKDDKRPDYSVFNLNELSPDDFKLLELMEKMRIAIKIESFRRQYAFLMGVFVATVFFLLVVIFEMPWYANVVVNILLFIFVFAVEDNFINRMYQNEYNKFLQELEKEDLK